MISPSGSPRPVPPNQFLPQWHTVHGKPFRVPHAGSTHSVPPPRGTPVGYLQWCDVWEVPRGPDVGPSGATRAGSNLRGLPSRFDPAWVNPPGAHPIGSLRRVVPRGASAMVRPCQVALPGSSHDGFPQWLVPRRISQWCDIWGAPLRGKERPRRASHTINYFSHWGRVGRPT